jgi:RNA polymerase sigma-70 factor (ECF subfamily)
LKIQNGESRREEARLLARLRAGDERAFEALYSRHMPPVYRYALRMTGSEADADDVVQESFLVLLRHARGYDPEQGELRSYLYGVARRMILHRLPAEPAIEIEEAETAAVDDPLDQIEQAQRVALLRAAVAALPADYREVVALCDLEEMTYENAAALIGCAVGTVRSRLHRARALLLAKLSKREKMKCRTP